MTANPISLLHRHRGFVKDVATLVTGKGAALLITFASTPIISRLFEPSHYGVAALFTSIVTILATLATLSWERAAIVAKSDGDAFLLSRLALYSLLSTCALLWLIGIAITALGLPLPYGATLGQWIWALPVGLFVFCMAQIADSWLTRSGEFRTIAFSDLGNSSGTAAFRITSGFAFGSSVWAAIGGYICGLVVELGIVFRGVRPWMVADGVGRPADLRELARQYSDFPVYSAPNSFVKLLSQDLPTVMFALMYSPAVVGFYAMASRLARLPLKLAAAALQRVILQRFARIANENRPLSPAYAKVSIGLALIALPPFAALWLWGDMALSLFLGPKWEVAGSYVVILVPWLYALWVASPAGTLLTVLRKQALLLRVQILLAIARLAVFGLAYALAASPEQALHAFVAVSTVASLSSSLISYVFALRADRRRGITGGNPA